MIASLGLPAEEHDRFRTVREALNQLVEASRDSRVLERLDKLETHISELADKEDIRSLRERQEQAENERRERERYWQIGPFRIGWRRRKQPPRED